MVVVAAVEVVDEVAAAFVAVCGLSMIGFCPLRSHALALRFIPRRGNSESAANARGVRTTMCIEGIIHEPKK